MLNQLQQDLLQAMKAKVANQVNALRLLLSNLKNRQIELGRELTADEMIAVVTKEVKQRRDSIAQFEAANRQDLVQNEQAELAVLQHYLPAQLSLDEVANHVDQAIAQTNATSAADMGKVMALVKPKVAGRADMGKVSALVKSKLG